MKIGIEAQRIFRKKKHGMDIVALELIRSLQEFDHKNEYIVFVKDDEDSDVLKESPNMKVVRVAGSPYPYWEQVRLPAEAKKNGVDLLHCTSNTAPFTVNIPLVVTLHDIIYLERLNLTEGSSYQILGNLYRRWNVPSMVKNASLLITVSEFEKQRIQEHFHLPQGRIETVYNGVGSHFRRELDQQKLLEVRKKYNLPQRFVFFLGNTDPKKNVQGVLRALSILKNSNRLNFTLVMPDIDRSYLERLAARNGDPDILKNISFTGYIPNEELPALYSLADLFLYPSIRESFGIPILEAMACGTPVVTSSTSAMPEVAGGAAYLIDPLDADSLADGINTVLKDAPLRSQLIEKGLLRAAAFSWKKNALRTKELYERVLKERDMVSDKNFSLEKKLN
jgi:glycosyltransferase involved in cell wall biosynthesis